MRTLVGLAVVTVVSAGQVLGATFLVRADGTGDFPTIQAAVTACVDGDIIELADGVFTGDGNRDVVYEGKAITVRSQSGNPATCIINPEGSEAEPHRAFAFWDGETQGSVLEDVTITGGYSPAGAFFDVGGGVSFNDGSATVRNCVFAENDGKFGGGAVSMAFAAEPLLVDCVFERNRALELAGAPW